MSILADQGRDSGLMVHASSLNGRPVYATDGQIKIDGRMGRPSYSGSHSIAVSGELPSGLFRLVAIPDSVKRQRQMTSQEYYLRPNVLLEPLVDRWYAWAHLIPPATAARNISERHLRIMESYIRAPDAHAAAVKNRKLLGGPFMEFGVSRVDAVKALLDRTKSKRAHLLALSQAIADLDALLRGEATGHSLEGLYERIPSRFRAMSSWFTT